MNKKVVVIGGGHGQAAICRGIKRIENIDICAIVTVADDGGSTGRLRRQFHIPAMGDIRNVMISLAESETIMSTLMDYRFEDKSGSGQDVAGHNLGNLVLTAMTQASGSFLDAIQAIGKVLNVKGKIIPATTQVITLFARMKDGVVVKGEANIPTKNNQIDEVFYDVDVKATPSAINAILEADLVLYGIGSVYTSILPNIIIPEIKQAISQTKAKCIYVCNAMTQPGETDGYCVEDHAEALLKHGCKLDGVLIAKDKVPLESIQKYKKEGSTVVELKDKKHAYTVYQEELLMFDDGLVRHDSMKIEKAVRKLLSE